MEGARLQEGPLPWQGEEFVCAFQGIATNGPEGVPAFSQPLTAPAVHCGSVGSEEDGGPVGRNDCLGVRENPVLCALHIHLEDAWCPAAAKSSANSPMTWADKTPSGGKTCASRRKGAIPLQPFRK